jgi:hypothetical protein
MAKNRTIARVVFVACTGDGCHLYVRTDGTFEVNSK